MSIHRILVDRCPSGRVEMRHDLVTIQIEVDPLITGSSFPAADQFTVKTARRGKIVHRKGEMKRRPGVAHLGSSLSEAELMQ